MACPSTTGCDKDCETCEYLNPICSWKTKQNGQMWDVWLTDCGHEYVEGRLTTNSQDNEEFKFCPYCGNEIRW